MLTRTIAPFAALALIIAVFAVALTNTPNASADVGTPKCTTSTVAAVPIGSQSSTLILGTSTNSRAYVRLQQVRTAAGVATSSVSISFDEGALATVNNGIQLSTSTPTIEFGINTFHPYGGAVHAITDTGSTTLRITECTYPAF